MIGTKSPRILVIAIASIGLLSTGVNEAYAVIPVVDQIFGNDPDDCDKVYSNGDTVTIVFDVATDRGGFPLGAPIGSGNVDTIFGFSEDLGNVHDGLWTSDTTFVITISDITGNEGVDIGLTNAVPGGTAITGAGAPLDIWVAASATFTGDFGLGNGSCGGGGSVPKGGHQAPTLGVTKDGRQLVDNGFSYNDNPVDAAYHNTPYPLIGTNVGEENVAKLKIYSHRGIDKIQHIALGFGLAKGQIFGESNVVVELDRLWNGYESLNVIDPENTLANVRVVTSEGKCKEDSNSVCLIVEVYHTFRKSLENNIVGVYVWDDKLSGWQNYFNDGVEVQGKSLDSAAQYQGIHKGKLITITETGKNTAIDEEGNAWTFDKSWNMDYIPQAKIDDGLTWHGFDRNHARFDTYKQTQEQNAEAILEKNCPHCIDESFGEIDENFSFEESHTSRANDQLLQKSIIKEKLRSFALFHQLFEVHNNH